MVSENKLETNRNILSTFLLNTPIAKDYRLENPNEIPFGYIYCILDKINGKQYIGSVYSIWVGIQKPSPLSSMHKRASMYLYEYNRAKVAITNGNKMSFRPIIQAMVDHGIENFIMFPIAETTRSNHTNIENYFINLYNTIKNGYNVNYAGSMITSGHTMSNKDKLLRSTGIIAINMNDKKLVMSQSMKLFGDFINTSKDQIKNGNRNGKPVKGWFIFYIDPDKRKYVLVNNVINDQNKRQQERHSDKAKQFYQGLYDAVDLYINDIYSNEYFSDFTKLPDLVYEETN